MRIPWRTIAWTTAISLPLVALGAVVWGSTRDLSRYQARLVDHVRKVTGRELTAKVPLTVHIGRHPALVAEGVTLTNAPWGARPELARVRKLTMYLDPLALLVGEVRVASVVLEGADILIERNEAGDTNLEMLPPPEGSGPRPGDNQSLRVKPNPAFPWIDTIELRDSVLTVSEGANRPPVVLEVPSATLKSTAANKPMQVDARFASPQSAPFALTGSMGSFDGWIRGVPGDIDLQGGLGQGKIAIKGSINTKGINLQVTADGPDVSVFAPYVHLPLPRGGPYAVNAKVTTQRNGLKVEVPSLRVGESDAAGEALFRVDRQGTPYVTINVDSNKIDLAGLHALKASTSGATGTQRFFPTAPFSANWLGRKSLSLTARIGEVTGLSGKIQNGSITLTSGETRFTFRAAASLGGGSAGFDLIYDPSGRFGLATLTATASHVSFADLGTLLGLDLGLKDAVGDIDLRLRGAGRAAHDSLNVANGTIEFSAGKGIWPYDGLGNWPVETQRLLGGGDTGVPFNCLAGSFEVRSGIANLRRLVVDTPRAALVGGGYLHFRSEGWEFILAPEARDTSGAALAVPLRLKGGTGRPTSGTLDASLSKLLVGGGPVPSLAGTLNTLARQPNANACALMLPKVDGMRPGLRAQLPVPAVDQRRAPPRRPTTPKPE
ncbi:MAG TPA: AsmA family protein [Reyranella sp.]|nr:AsmA family protein [Reyranella sp.]